MKRPASRSLLGNLFWLPWSGIALVLTLSYLIGLTILVIPGAMLIPFERWQLKWPHPAVGLSTLFSLNPIRTHVDPNYRFDRVSVFAQNHVSILDGFIACGAIRVPLCGLENAAHLSVPGYGWLLRLANAIPVRRAATGGRYAEVQQAFRERASRGISIITFPEGHRTLDGNLRPFKKGVFRIARDAGLPIVPIAVRGAYRMLPKGQLAIRPGWLDVYIAPQIDTDGLTDEQIPLVMERVRQIMEAWIHRGEKLGHLALQPLQ